jgi:hypothetical protein
MVFQLSLVFDYYNNVKLKRIVSGNMKCKSRFFNFFPQKKMKFLFPGSCRKTKTGHEERLQTP